jgi:hypothetical protein
VAVQFSERLAGDSLDPWQTLWGFWWFGYALSSGQSIFFCPLLWWPDGVTLWFQSWDLPSAVLAMVLSSHWSQVEVYNAIVLMSFVLGGLTFYELCRGVWGGYLGPLLAGCIYTFSTFHTGHAQMQLHLASIQWAPLYFLGLHKLVGTPRLRYAVLTGVGLSLAAAASMYHLLFCLT